MRKVIGGAGALVVVIAACHGQTANLGGSDDAGNPGASSSGSSSGGSSSGSGGSSSGSSSSGSSSGVTSDDGGGVGPTLDTPVGPFACDGGTEPGTLSDGSGFMATIPPACNDQDGGVDGPPESFASVAAVTSAIVGTWFDCGSAGGSTTSVLSTLTGSGSAFLALQLTSGGEFTVLEGHGIYDGDPSTSANWTLVPGAELGDGGQGAPVTGTYQVTDASATLGPGTYQITLQAPGGVSYVAQVLVLSGSTNVLRFVFSAGPGVEDLAPAYPLSFRAGVCDNGPFGPDYVLATDAEISARIEGSWFWCDGFNGGGANNSIGITFPGDGTWWNLTEDSTGTISRMTDGADHGTLEVSGGQIVPVVVSSTTSGNGGPEMAGVPAFAACSTKMAGPGPVDHQTWFQKSSTTY